MTTTEKTCFKCRKTLPLTEFYRHKRMGDGRLNKCKECTKFDVFSHRHGAGREKVLAYDRMRGSRHTEEYQIEYRAKNHEKCLAHSKVNFALKKGTLKKMPCFICGADKAHAHHPDYSAPLDVVWLCPAHHSQAHALVKKCA